MAEEFSVMHNRHGDLMLRIKDSEDRWDAQTQLFAIKHEYLEKLVAGAQAAIEHKRQFDTFMVKRDKE